MTDTPDIVELRVPRGAAALPLMRVVMGGFASRHDLPLDQLDDLQLAVESLLAEEAESGDDLTLDVSGANPGFRVRLGGLANQSVRGTLMTADPFQPCEGCLLDVRLLLGSLVDGYRVVETGAHSFAVEMEKRAS